MGIPFVSVCLVVYLLLVGCGPSPPAVTKKPSQGAQAHSVSSSEELNAEQAALVACKLANQKCQKEFGRQPFSSASYKACAKQHRWTWGALDPAGIGGYSARVAFDLDGGNPKVEVFLSTDIRQRPGG